MRKQSLFVKLYLSAMLVFFASIGVNAQVTIGSSNPPSPWSLLDLNENVDDTNTSSRALHLPRLNYAQRDALINESSPPLRQDSAMGLMIFNVDNQCLEFWSGSEWISRCVDAPRPLRCGTGGVAARVRIGENYYYTHEFMTNGVMRCWMVQNLNQGTLTNQENSWDSWCVNGIWQHEDTNRRYRGLYFGWGAAMDACPAGWRLPTPEEFGTNANEGLRQTLAGMPNNNDADNPRRFWTSAPYSLAGRRTDTIVGIPVDWTNWNWSGSWWSSGVRNASNSYRLDVRSDGFMSFGVLFNALSSSVRCIQDLE